METKNQILLIVGILVIAFLIAKPNLFAVTGSETMTRTAPTTINPSSTFQITYTAVGASGTWFASLVDAVSGGCQFPAGTSLSTFMVSDEGTTKQVTVTAPSSGTCTFHGDYMYGNFPTKTFADLVVNVCAPSCVRPTDMCQLTSSNGCGGTCTWTVTQNTLADINCNNQVDRTELGAYAMKWINGQVTRQALGQAAMAWIGTG